jgi:hypothetical protein
VSRKSPDQLIREAIRARVIAEQEVMNLRIGLGKLISYLTHPKFHPPENTQIPVSDLIDMVREIEISASEQIDKVAFGLREEVLAPVWRPLKRK